MQSAAVLRDASTTRLLVPVSSLPPFSPRVGVDGPGRAALRLSLPAFRSKTGLFCLVILDFVVMRISVLTQKRKCHILAASRIYPRGWGRIWVFATTESQRPAKRLPAGMEASGALRIYVERQIVRPRSRNDRGASSRSRKSIVS